MGTNADGATLYCFLVGSRAIGKMNVAVPDLNSIFIVMMCGNGVKTTNTTKSNAEMVMT